MSIRWRHSGHLLTVYVIGLTLLGAGLLKLSAQLTPQPQETGLFGNRWLAVGIPWCEVALGLGLILRLGGRCLSGIATACFIAFLPVSLSRALAGETDCGCFGSVPVNPWFTAAFDALAATGLALTLLRPPLCIFVHYHHPAYSVLARSAGGSRRCPCVLHAHAARAAG